MFASSWEVTTLTSSDRRRVRGGGARSPGLLHPVGDHGWIVKQPVCHAAVFYP